MKTSLWRWMLYSLIYLRNVKRKRKNPILITFITHSCVWSFVDGRLYSRVSRCTESFEHREQDVAHFGCSRLTIERANKDKGAVSEAENKRRRSFLRVVTD